MDDALWIKLFLFSKNICFGAARLLSGLDIIRLHSIYTSEDLRRQTSAIEAEHDEYRGGAMAFDDSFARNHADSARNAMGARAGTGRGRTVSQCHRYMYVW